MKFAIYFALFYLSQVQVNGQGQISANFVAKNFNCNRIRGSGIFSSSSSGGSSSNIKDICKSLLTRIGPSFRLAQSLDCGQVSKISGDLRTNSPWTAGIYIRDKNSQEDSKFYTNAVIIGPTTILTVAGGAFGALPRGSRGTYFISSPQNFIIGVGLNSTDLRKRDQNSQLAEVQYIVPYNGHEDFNGHFHYFLYHLKKPLNLKTPYARAICLPFVIQNLKPSTGGLNFFQSGFARDSTTELGKDYKLQILNATGGTLENCAAAYRYNYKSSKTDHIYCGRVNYNQDTPKNLCFLHGSIVTLSITNRWFLTGLTSLIPFKNRRKCDEKTTYFYGRILKHLDWMFHSYKCSPDRFACSETECINLNQVCNGIPNCLNKMDENPIYCNSTDICRRKGKFRCSLEDKECINPEQICNGKKDCPSGNDEIIGECAISDYKIAPLSINQCKSPLEGRDSDEIQGIDLKCTENQKDCSTRKSFNPGEKIVLKCQNYYQSKYSYSKLELTCDFDGGWTENLPFSCEIVCGNEQRNFGQTYPWNAQLFKTSNMEKSICNLNIIERDFLITSAHCLGQKDEQNQYKIKIGHKIFQVKNAWKSELSEVIGQIAIIQIDTPLEYGNNSRPICYLGQSKRNNKSIGKVSSNKNLRINFNLDCPVEFYSPEIICVNKLLIDNRDTRTRFGLGDGLMIKDRHGKFYLEGVLMNENERILTFANLDFYTDWIVDILETNS